MPDVRPDVVLSGGSSRGSLPRDVVGLPAGRPRMGEGAAARPHIRVEGSRLRAQGANSAAVGGMGGSAGAGDGALGGKGDQGSGFRVQTPKPAAVAGNSTCNQDSSCNDNGRADDDRIDDDQAAGARDESADLAEAAPPEIAAGFPQDQPAATCVRLDAEAVLRATPRSFALRVRGDSMRDADIHDGDVVIGEFTPEVRPGAVVVALIDGAAVLKRLVIRKGRPLLASANPDYRDLLPLTELVIQGVVHTVVRKVKE